MVVTWAYNADTNTATASGAGSTNFAALVAADTAGGWGKFTSDATGTQIQIAGKIVIGDGTNTCAFSDTAKQIFINITGLGTPAIKVNDYSTLTLGTLISSTLKTTKSGCAFYITMDYYGNGLIQGTNTATKGASIYLYGCLFLGATEDGTYFSPEAVVWGGLNVKIYDCTASYVRNLGRSLPITADLSRNTISFSEKIGESRLGTTTDTKIASCISIWVFSYATSVTVKNLYSYNCTNGFYVYESTVNHYLIDVTPDVWKFTFSAGYMNTKVFRQYTFNLEVYDAAGSAIQNADVLLEQQDGTDAFDVDTDATGAIAEQTVSRGYYAQDTGDTLQDYGPFKLTVSKAGYQTYVHDGIVLDEKIDWRISLKKLSCIGNGTIKFRDV